MIFRILLALSNIVLLLPLSVLAQETQNGFLADNILESIAVLDNSSDFSNSESFLFLAELAQQPAHITKLDQDMIPHFLFLASAEKAALENHIRQYGNLKEPYELQIVDGLPLEKAKLMALFFIKKENPHQNFTLKELLPLGKTIFRTTWQTKSNGFETNPIASQTRIAYRLPGYYSAGLTMDKDQGERSLNDHLGFHIFANKPSKFIDKIALGDYRVRLGQGLILNDGLGPIKGSSLNTLKLSTPVLMPHQSPNEYFFQRGAAVQWRLSKQLKLLTFASFRSLDASVTENETERFFRTIQINELHRTASEIRNKNAYKRFLSGARIQWNKAAAEIGLNFLYTRLSIPLRRTQLYQQFWTQGQEPIYTSLDYNYQFKNISFFGEMALQGTQGWATQNTLGIAFSNLEIMLLQRFYGRRFESLWGNALSENSRINDESGFFMGFKLKVHPKLYLTSYADFWNHSWIRSSLDRPSGGSEFLSRIDYRFSRYKNMYALFRYRQKPEEVNDLLQNKERLLFRINYGQTARIGFSWRTRFDLLFERTAVTESGYMVFQDINYATTNSKFTFRLAYFQAPNVRIYTFEPNLSYQFGFTSFGGTGLRPVLIMKHRLNRHLKIELKAATEALHLDTYEVGLQVSASF